MKAAGVCRKTEKQSRRRALPAEGTLLEQSGGEQARWACGAGLRGEGASWGNQQSKASAAAIGGCPVQLVGFADKLGPP